MLHHRQQLRRSMTLNATCSRMFIHCVLVCHGQRSLCSFSHLLVYGQMRLGCVPCSLLLHRPLRAALSIILSPLLHLPPVRVIVAHCMLLCHVFCPVFSLLCSFSHVLLHGEMRLRCVPCSLLECCPFHAALSVILSLLLLLPPCGVVVAHHCRLRRHNILRLSLGDALRRPPIAACLLLHTSPAHPSHAITLAHTTFRDVLTVTLHATSRTRAPHSRQCRWLKHEVAPAAPATATSGWFRCPSRG